jgi:hypothetical protein
MILNLIATLLIGIIAARQTFSAVEVWGGPYPGKGKFILITAGVLLGALLTLLAVWL